MLVKQDVEKEDEDSDSSGKVGRGRKKRPKEEEDEDFGSDLDSTGTRKKKVGPVLINNIILNFLILRYFLNIPSPTQYQSSFYYFVEIFAQQNNLSVNIKYHDAFAD